MAHNGQDLLALLVPKRTASEKTAQAVPTVLGSRQPTVLGSRAPTVLGDRSATTLGSTPPTVLGSRAPSVLGSRAPTTLGSTTPTVLGSRQPTVLGTRAPTTVGTRAPSVLGTRAPTVLGSIRPTVLGGSGTKTAQAAPVATATPDRGKIGISVDRLDAERARVRAAQAQRAQEAAVARRKPSPHDQLPDVIAARKKKILDRAFGQYLDQQKIVPRKTQADIMREHKDFKPLGDYLMPEEGYREEGKTTGEIIRNGLRDFGEGWAHDTLNNWHMFANNMQRGAGDVGRLVAKWADPKSWIGSDTEVRTNRAAHDRAWDNASAASLEKDRRILESMQTGLGADELTGRKGVGKWDRALAIANYATRAGGGQYAGGAAALAGAGAVARPVATTIKAPMSNLARTAGNLTTRASNAVGNSRAGQAVSSTVSAVKNSRPVQATSEMLSHIADKARYFRSRFGNMGRSIEASRQAHITELANRGIDASRFPELASPQSYRAWWAHGMGGRTAIPRVRFEGIAGIRPPRAWSWRAGRAVEKAVNEIGNTLAAPAQLVADMSNPVGTIARSGTANAVAQPVKSLYHLIRNPRAAAAYARQHPFRTAGRMITAPVRYPFNIAKGAVTDTLGGLWRGTMPFFRNTYMLSAYDNARSGNYGSALGDIGEMGLYQLLPNKVVLPAMVGRETMNMMQNSGEQEGE